MFDSLLQSEAKRFAALVSYVISNRCKMQAAEPRVALECYITACVLIEGETEKLFRLREQLDDQFGSEQVAQLIETCRAGHVCVVCDFPEVVEKLRPLYSSRRAVGTGLCSRTLEMINDLLRKMRHVGMPVTILLVEALYWRFLNTVIQPEFLPDRAKLNELLRAQYKPIGKTNPRAPDTPPPPMDDDP
ncbi:hypothetical protein AAVH_11068 [Aphelenchoides avenae]|nr:hypothetical protein AAVH_11068 [Aphelenchus avenae]